MKTKNPPKSFLAKLEEVDAAKELEVSAATPPQIDAETPLIETPPEVEKTEIPPKKEEEEVKVEKKEEPLPAVETPKSGKDLNFSALRQSKKELEEKYSAIQKQLAEKERLIGELNGTIEKVSIERSPKFQKTFIAPLKEAREEVFAYAEEVLGDKELAAKAFKLKGKARFDFLEEEVGSSLAASEFLRLLNIHDKRQGAVDRALADHEKVKESFVEEETFNEAAQLKELEDNFDSFAESISSRFVLFKQKPGDSEFNTGVESRLAQAKALVLGTASEEDIRLAPFLAVMAKDYLEENNNLKKELEKYKKVVGNRSATPGTGINRGVSRQTSASGKPKGIMETIKSLTS